MKGQTAKHNTASISAKALLIPIIASLAVLHAVIITSIVRINVRSNELSAAMQSSGEYVSEATSLLAGSSLLSETCTNFVLMPTAGSGETNIVPLTSYAEELQKPEHRGEQIMADFRAYGIGEEPLALLQEAADCADNMLKAQLRALALATDVCRLPDIPPLNAIPTPDLSPGEAAMTDGEKLDAAKALVLSAEYSLNKANVSKDVNLAVALLQEETDEHVAQIRGSVARLRTLLWIVTALIITLLVVMFVMMYQMLLKPLMDFARLIPDDEPFDERRGLAEVRLVSSAYNSQLKRRSALEALLRSAAETDKLTGIPNRYGFEKYLLEAGESGYSLAVILFDVNYLKLTNDTLGHAAGDKLIRATAECIKSCFGDTQDCCYARFGGDEFAAALKNVSTDKIEQMIDSFRGEQRRRDISISWGYAYTDERGKTNVKALMDEADKRMYEQKKFMHENGTMPRALEDAIRAGKAQEKDT